MNATRSTKYKILSALLAATGLVVLCTWNFCPQVSIAIGFLFLMLALVPALEAS